MVLFRFVGVRECLGKAGTALLLSPSASLRLRGEVFTQVLGELLVFFFVVVVFFLNQVVEQQPV